MRYREVAIEDDKSIDDSGTETIPINVRDPITALIVRMKAQNSAHVMNQPMERQISKVEIIDGGTTYWSLNGQMAVAAACYGLKRWPHHWIDERSGSNQRANFPILFGRYLGDPEFAFDPTRLNNPALRVTWTDQASYTDGSLTLGVTARVMEDVPAPEQVLMWREIDAWTSVSGSPHTVDLPVDFPYRHVMMRPWKVDTLPTTIWSNFKLDCDVGKFIPFDLASHEFRDILKMYDGPFHNRQFVYGYQATMRQAWMGETLLGTGSAMSAQYYMTAWTAFWPWIDVNIVHNDGTPAGTTPGELMVTGLFPHTCYKYNFGLEQVPGTWFDPTIYKDVRLQLTEGASDAACAVAVQQPRSL